MSRGLETALANVLFIPTMIVLVLVFGTVIRRLLGVRVGVVRTALAALLAIWVSAQLLRAFVPAPTDTDPGTILLLLLLAVCCASIISMIVLVLAEVLLPDGSLPGPVELWRGWRSRVARTRRYWQVLRIALRHGLGRFLRGQRHTGVDSAPARRELARSLRRALDEGGVTFVKLGQLLSTRRDLVPPEFADELTALQDSAAPVAWDEVAAVLREELGDGATGQLGSVDPVPLAAASVAQVHAGRLRDGTEVVVKVQRPGVGLVVERDLDIVRRLVRTLETRTRWAGAVGLRELVDGFAQALHEELDFRIELDNLNAVGAALAASAVPGVRVPGTHPELCTRRVLVMQRLPGTPLGSADQVLASLPPRRRREAARSLLDTMLEQVLDRGLFHVDLHPGNVLVAEDGTLGLLDLGSVGRLDGTTRTAVANLMAALGRTDSLAATDALLELVDRPDVVDERALERDVGGLIVRFASPGAAAGPAAFGALMRLVTAHRLAVPPQVAAVFRGFATVEGTLRVLDPGLDLLVEARAAGARRFGAAVAPQRLRGTVEDELVTLLPVLRRLPRRIDRIADAVEHGRLAVNVRLLADRRDRQVVTGLVHQVLLTVLGATTGIMAVLLLGQGGGPRLTPSIELYALLGYGLLVIAVVLVLRVLVVIFRRDPT